MKKKDLFFLFYLLFFVSPLFSQNLNQLSDDQISKRIRLIQSILDNEQFSSKLWWYGYLGVYATATSYASLDALGAFPNNDANKRFSGNEIYKTSLIIKPFLGFSYLLIFPFSPAYLGGTLQKLPEETREQKIFKLENAEKYLNQAAKREKNGKELKNYLSPIAINALASSAIFLFEKNRNNLYNNAIIMSLISIAVGESAVILQPNQAAYEWDNYSETYKKNQNNISWFITPLPFGFAAGIQF